MKNAVLVRATTTARATQATQAFSGGEHRAWAAPHTPLRVPLSSLSQTKTLLLDRAKVAQCSRVLVAPYQHLGGLLLLPLLLFYPTDTQVDDALLYCYYYCYYYCTLPGG